MTLRSRLRRRLVRAAAATGAVLATGALAGSAQAAYTPGLEQYAGAQGCTTGAGGCAATPNGRNAGGIARLGQDVYVAQSLWQGNAPALLHFRRTGDGLVLQGCVAREPLQVGTVVCGAAPKLPQYFNRPAVSSNVVFVAGSVGSTGVVTALPRDPDTGLLDADAASCSTANASVAAGCASGPLDRLGSGVVDLATSEDGTTVTTLTSEFGATQIVTYAWDADDGLTAASCLSSADAACARPEPDERPLLFRAARIVLAPDGEDAYVSTSKGLLHFARNTATGELSYDDCVGDSLEVAGLCDDGPGDFAGVDSIAMTSDDQLIAVAAGDDSRSVVRLLRDGSGTLTEAGCIGTVAEDGCGTAPGVLNPMNASATPDGKNVVIADGDGARLVTLIAGGAAGLRKLPGDSGCLASTVVAAVDDCPTGLRGVQFREGPVSYPVDLVVHDDDVISTMSGAMLLLGRGRAPGCLQRSITVQRPVAAIPLVCADPNGDQVALVLGRQPAHGTLGEIDASASNVLFTPDDTYEGPDSFTYGAGDGTHTSAATTISLTLPSGPNTVKPTTPGGGAGGGGDVDADPPAGGGKTDDAPATKTEPAAPAKPSPGGLPAAPAGIVDLAPLGKALKVSSKRIVSLTLACRGLKGGTPCKGTVKLSSAGKVSLKGRSGKPAVVAFGQKPYAIPAGASLVVNLRLPAAAAAAVTKKRPLAAVVTATGVAPSSVKAVTAAVTLKR